MENNSSIKVVVASHKNYKMPHDPIYIPTLVGAELKKEYYLCETWQKDNEGDNISYLNPYYCELTALYWAWKNLNADYIGLVHYRRFFSLSRNKKDYINTVFSSSDFKKFSPDIQVFVPKKRRYFIETIYKQYEHNHYHEHLDVTRQIIIEKQPDFLESFDVVMNRKWAYMFNMVIMRRELLDDYCNWLFPLLFELQKRIKYKELSQFQARLFGRVSERVFNVWLDKRIKDKTIDPSLIIELPCVHIEKINWFKKATVFLLAKFFGIKPKKSC